MTGIKRKSSRLLSLLVSFAIAASIFTSLVPGASLTVYAASPYSSDRVRISDVSTGDIISKNCQLYKNNTFALEIYDSDGTTLLNSYGMSGFISNVQPGYDTIVTQGGKTVKLKKLDPQTEVTSVSLDQPTLDLTAGGDTATLVATVVANYDLIKTVEWSSSDSSVATVSNGVVSPVKAGTTTIKATSGWDGTKYVECAVTVRGSVTISGGANATVSGGATTQNDLTGAMTTVTYTANSGCIFPAESDYYTTTNGITVSRTSDTVVEVAGTPTSNVNITVPDAVANVDKTSLNDAITAAETLYNGIKDNTDYTEIANTLKSAIDTAKAVAESNEADQAAVDTAAAAITTAKTDAVVGMINALPAASGVTTSDKDTIEAVRAAFDSLSDMEKEKVDPDTLKKLTDAEAALDAIEALATAKTEAKADLDTLLSGKNESDYDADDWTALNQAITDGKTAIDNAATTDAVATAKSNAVDAVNAIKTKAQKALDSAKTTAKATVNGVNATDYIAGDQSTVTSAKTAALAAIESATTVTEVEAAIHAFDEAISDCTTQAAADLADAKTNATTTVNGVNAADYIANDQEKVTNAKTAALAAIGAATTEAEVTAALNTFNKAISGCTTQKEADDTAAAQVVTDKITALPAAADVKTTDEEAISAARTAYDALTNDQKAKVSEADYKKLTDAETALAAAKKEAADTAAAAQVTEKINALPAANDVTAADKADIEAARAAYDALTAEQKAKVSANTLKKLTDAEAALAEALHVHELVPKSGKEATCTEDGYKAYYECSGCHKLFSDAEGKNRISAPEVIKKLGHSLKLVEEKAPTKTEPGVRKHYECERCHKLFSDAEGKTAITNDDIVIPVMIHDLTAVSAKAPTCTEDGHKAHYECKDTDCGCGKLYEDKYGEHETTYDKVKILATGHSLEKVNAKAATCTEKGNIEYWKCTKCGKLFKDADGKEEITAEATVTAALGHDKENLIHHPAVAAGHDEEGSKEYYECPKCHKKFSDPECENEITEAEIVVPPVGYAKLGEIYEVGDFKYQITNPKINGTGTVTLIGVINKTASVSIPKTVNIKLGTYKVNRIGPKAFYGNKTIKKLHIGDNVETIDASAFYGCSKLTKVSGGKVLKTIGKSAFAKCSKLKSFSITSTSLRTIGAYVFKKDKKLKTLNIKRTTKLTKSGVKKALKGSKISIVKVKRSKVKTYKKFFKVSNSGRRVKVR